MTHLTNSPNVCNVPRHDSYMHVVPSPTNAVTSWCNKNIIQGHIWKFFWKSIAQTGFHWACQFVCLWFWQTGASFDYYKRDRTRNLKTVVQRFYIGKSLKKGHEMHSGCLESKKGLNEMALSLDRFEFASKSLK